MTPPAPTPERQPSDEAFALIAACRLAHFYDGLCAECVDAALAQAEREREDEIVKLRADVVWIAQQRDENEQWARDRAAVAIQMADERDAARAEVERLKDKAILPDEYEQEMQTLKADLARVRALSSEMDDAGLRWWASQLRAALEGL